VIGQTLNGQYEIVRQLGSGGMGAVYEALSEKRERVAIKVISTGDITKDKQLVGRFHREAKAASGIDTDHIVRVLATGTDSNTDQPFMVMEYLVGEDLHSLFHRLGPLQPDLAVRIMAQACLGLAKAHEAHVVHRDIKPANIFLAERPNDERIVKILDFGIAKIKLDKANATDTTGLTRTGSMIGSPLYMSPEQARGSKAIDHRADIWSLGVVSYQALTGRTPNQDIEALGELIIAICSEAPRPLQELAPWVPPEVAAIVHRTLRFDPAERYQTAGEMFEALKPLLQPANEGASSLSSPAPRSRPANLVIRGAALVPMSAEARAVVAKVAAIPPATPMTRSGGSRNSVVPPNVFEESAPTTSSGAVRADGGTNEGLSQALASRGRSSSLRLYLGAAGVAAVATAGVIYFSRTPDPPPVAVAATATPPPIPTSAAAAPASAPAVTPAPEASMRTVKVQIVPSEAQVEVEGNKVASVEGVIEITGGLGSVHHVKISKGTVHTQKEVVITAEGPKPPKVELEAAGPRPGGGRPAPRPTGAPKATSTAGSTAPPITTFKEKFE
jgi:eukaryotic-like serine/threonine-protein kinase